MLHPNGFGGLQLQLLRILSALPVRCGVAFTLACRAKKPHPFALVWLVLGFGRYYGTVQYICLLAGMVPGSRNQAIPVFDLLTAIKKGVKTKA